MARLFRPPDTHNTESLKIKIAHHSTCLRRQFIILEHLGNVQIAEFDPAAIFADENIGRFDIAVEDVQFVQGFQASDDVDEIGPDCLFWDRAVGFSVVFY